MHDENRDETMIHWSLRQVQRVVRFALAASAVVTGVSLLFLGPLVVVPAMIMVFCYLAVLVVNLLERRARPGTTEASMEPLFDEPPDGDAGEAGVERAASPRESRRPRRVRGARQAAGVKVAIGIGATLVVLSALLAAALFDQRHVALGAFAVFAWLLFTGVPFWLATVTEEVEEAEEQITGQPAASSK